MGETQAALQALQTQYESAQAAHLEQRATLERQLADARSRLARVSGDAAAALERARAADAERLGRAESRIGDLTERVRRSYPHQAAAAMRDALERSESELAQARAEAAAARERAGAAHAEQLVKAEARIAALTERVRQSPTPDGFAELQGRLAQAERELGRVKSEADAAVAEARAEGVRQADGAQAKLAALSERLASEQAEAARRQSDQDAVIADLKDALSRVEQELGAARAAAAAAADKATDEAGTRIAVLEAAVEAERRRASAAQAELRAETEQAVSSVRGLYRRFSELGAMHTARGMLLKLAEAELRFPTGAATLTDSELPSLDRIAGLLADHPALEARIEGHTDSLGDEETNQVLSRQRAEAVKAALIERGVDPGRLTAEGVGPARPIADNASPAGRAQNRRVEVYVSEE